MRYYLYLLVVAVCEARIITRDLDNMHYQTIYHGNGATSYQNVQIDNHDSIPVSTNYVDHAEIQKHHYAHHYPEIVPIVEHHNDEDHIDISDSALYEELSAAVADFKSDLQDYIDHYDEEHNYDLHL